MAIGQKEAKWKRTTGTFLEKTMLCFLKRITNLWTDTKCNSKHHSTHTHTHKWWIANKKKKKQKFCFLQGIRRHMRAEGQENPQFLDKACVGSYKNPQNWNNTWTSEAGQSGWSWSPNLGLRILLLNKYSSIYGVATSLFHSTFITITLFIKNMTN